MFRQIWTYIDEVVIKFICYFCWIICYLFRLPVLIKVSCVENCLHVVTFNTQ